MALLETELYGNRAGVGIAKVSSGLVAINAMRGQGTSMVIGALAELVSTPVDDGVAVVQTLGYHTPGDGGHGVYKRVVAEPPHAAKAIAQNGVFLELVPDQIIRVRQLGAQTGTDVTAAIQNAIDFALFGNAGHATGHDVLVDVSGTLSDTIHVGYGNFQGLSLHGLGGVYQNVPNFSGTLLTTTMTDRPAVSVNAARRTRIVGISFTGPAFEAIRDIDKAAPSYMDEATFDTALGTVGIVAGKRYAPHAAIAIDAYSGDADVNVPPVAGDRYPQVTPPPWVPTQPDDYHMFASSSIVIEDCFVSGYEVGMVLSPSPHDRNGDFFTVENCGFSRLKYGISVGQTQGRIGTARQCVTLQLHTFLTNCAHGPRRGNFQLIEGCSIASGVARIFDFASTGTNGPLTITGCDSELLWTIGNIEGSTSVDKQIVIDNCTMVFSHNDEVAGHPPAIITGRSSGQVVFKSGIVSYYTVLSSQVPLQFDGTRLQAFNTMAPTGRSTEHDARAKPYGKAAHNALLGGIVHPFGSASQHHVNVRLYDIDDGTSALSFTAEGFVTGGRKVPISILAPSCERAQDAAARVVRRDVGAPSYAFYFVDRTVLGATITGRTVTFTARVQDMPDAATALQRGFNPGGVIRDQASGTVMFIRNVDPATRVVTAELQTNYRPDGIGGYTLFDATDFDLTTTGTWELVPSGIYLTDTALTGTTTAGSATVTTPVDPSAIVGAGDAPSAGTPLDDAAPAVVSAISATSITLDTSATVSHDLMRLDWWVRPVAGSSAR